MENVRPFPHQADHDGDDDHLDAERFVLGTAMNAARTIETTRKRIQGGDFRSPAHEVIWTSILNLHDRGESTHYLSVIAELDRAKELRRAGGIGYITRVADYVGGGDADHWAGKVRDAADLRAEANLGRMIVQRATAPDAEPGSAVTFIDDYLTRQKERAAGRSGDPVDALLAELLDASSLDNMPSLEPLIGDLLHLDSIARVIGPSGHMKSFMTIDFAGHVGTGMKWHGHYVRQGTVVYLVAEGARGIRKRVRAWEKHYGIKMDNVLFLPRPVQAMSPEWDILIEAMRRLEPSLIVIDTQARVSVGVEENSAKELGVVIDRMEQLRTATAACILVIHHTGHVGDHGRGSTAAKGALQSELHVSKKGDSAKNITVTLKTGKQKDDEEGGDLQFGLRVITLDGETKADGRPVTSVVLESLDARPRALEPGTPEWLVHRLDSAGIPIVWGAPRVTRWCADAGISIAKSKIEKALQIRKARDSFDDPRMGSENLPGNLPGATFNQPPQAEPGRSGENTQNPSSDLPENAGEVAGKPANEPPSPAPPSREQGGRGEGDENTPHDTPRCTICGHELHGFRLDRGYDTCLACDPTTGSHPDAA